MTNVKTPSAKISNMQSHNGNDVPNQFEIKTNEGLFFQSYQSIIAFIPNEGKTQLDQKYWDYSNTTAKYRIQFLNETTNETEAKIKAGEYVLTNLN